MYLITIHIHLKKNNLVPSSIKCEGNILKSLSQRIESFVTSDEPGLEKIMKFLKKDIKTNSRAEEFSFCKFTAFSASAKTSDCGEE